MRMMYLPAAREDAPRIYQLCKQLIDQYEDVNSIPYEKVLAWVEEKIESGILSYTRIEIEGQTVGYFHLCRSDDGRLELDDFYILEPYRGKGIGTEVLKEIFGNAGEDVMLYVFNKNTGAVRLYERMGFETEKQVGKTRRIMVKKKQKNQNT